MNDIYDYTAKDAYGKYGSIIPMPSEMESFLKDIDAVCRKHRLSISHEDGQGSFVIEAYKSSNIDWLYNASKCYRKEDLIEDDFEFALKNHLPIDNSINIC